MSSARSSGASRLALIVVLIVFTGPGRAQTAGPDFAGRCAARNQALPSALQMPIDLVAVCRCQAATLRAMGYDPERYTQQFVASLRGIADADLQLGRTEGLDPKARAAITTAAARIAQDEARAFERCITPEITRGVMRNLSKSLEKPS